MVTRYRHGLRRTKIYGIWMSMMSRCYNPNNPSFRNYGGRGITVCDRWHDAALFHEDMGKRPDGFTMDRINNDGPYEPGNCRWATQEQQHRNRRATVFITAGGVTRTMTEWAGLTRIPVWTIWQRLKLGWNPEDSVMVSVADGRKFRLSLRPKKTKWRRPSKRVNPIKPIEGKTVKLSPTEQSILSTLEQANGEVVSRHAFGLTSESNTLEVLISRIRKKMDVSRNNGGTVKSIQTIRSVGYRLVTP